MNPPIVSICILVYGDYVELARRCIGSIIQNCPRAEYRLLVGANAPGPETVEYLKSLKTSGAIDTLIISAENLNKCPMMRRLFAGVDTEYIWWFDDDSWIQDPNAFTTWLAKTRTSSPGTMLWGHLFYVSHEHEFSYGRDAVEWVRQAEWFAGKAPPSWQPGGKGVFNFEGRESGDGRWFFAAGGCWLIKTEAVRALDWPDRRLLKEGDDVLLCEALRQKGWRTERMGLNGGIVLNDHARRGIHRDTGRIVSETKRTHPVEVVLLNWRRPENVRRIIEAFRQQARFCSITVIDAADKPEYALPKEVLRSAHRHFIFSHNFGSFNRFVPTLGYMAPFTLFHDDDLLPGPNAVEHLLLCAAEYPQFSVMGEFGRHITPEGKELVRDMPRSRQKVQPVDFLVRSYFMRTANLKHIFLAAAEMGIHRVECEDDLLMCTSIQRGTKYPCVVTREAGQDTSLAMEHLPEPHALWHRKDHFHRRAEFIRRQMAAGWRPLQAETRETALHP